MEWDAVKALVGIFVLIVTLWTGLSLWAQRWLLKRFEDALGQRFDAINARLDQMERDHHQQEEKRHQVEKKLLQLQADMPIYYVRKEDQVRAEGVFHAKLDALWAKLDSFTSGGRNGGS